MKKVKTAVKAGVENVFSKVCGNVFKTENWCQQAVCIRASLYKSRPIMANDHPCAPLTIECNNTDHPCGK